MINYIIQRHRSVISRGNKSKIIDTLCEIAGTDMTEMSSIIPSLFPSGGLLSSKCKVSHHDLAIFICSNRSVKISETARLTLNNIKRRALWIFTDKKSAEWEFGTFKPEVIGEEEQ